LLIRSALLQLVPFFPPDQEKSGPEA